MYNITLIVLVSIFITTSIVMVVFLFKFYKRNNRTQSENLRLIRQIEEYKANAVNQGLEQLQIELNPHLFKNILNTIQSYAYKTHITLDYLGNLFDYILYDSRNKLITVKEDIEFAKNFVELNKLRLSPLFDIKLRLDIDEEDPFFHKLVIVPLATGHLIENAFKHGDLDSSKGFITIFLNLRKGIYFCHVINKIDNSLELQPKGGLGKETLHKRLKLVYEDRYELHYMVENNIYSASLKIDLNEQ